MKVSDLYESNSNGYVFTGLYHSSDDKLDKFYKAPTTEPRIPKDTFLPIHNYVNELSIGKFGVPIRNCFFALNKINTGYYGSECFSVYVKSRNTRFFISKEVPDFTLDFTERHSASPQNIAREFIKRFYAEIGQDFTYLFDEIMREFKSCETFEDIYDVISEVFDFDEYPEETKSKFIQSSEELIESFKRASENYVYSVDEVSYMDAKTFGKSEVMIYSTSYIKLINTEHDDESQ